MARIYYWPRWLAALIAQSSLWAACHRLPQSLSLHRGALLLLICLSLSLAVDGCAVRSSFLASVKFGLMGRPPQGVPLGATLFRHRANTLRIRLSVRPSIDRAVFSNGQSGVNYPTEKAPADAIAWEIKALTSQSVSQSARRSAQTAGVRLFGYCPEEPRLRTPI